MNTYKSSIRSIVLVLLFGMISQVPAALVWYSEFETYDTSGGSVPLTTNATGDNDTFSNTATSSIDSPQFLVTNTGVPDFMSGNALQVTGTSIEGSSFSFNLRQFNLPDIGTTGVMIISFDMLRATTTNTAQSLNAQARINGTTSSGNQVSIANTAHTQTYRVTIVINRSGETVALPYGLGSLANEALTIYRYDGTNAVITSSSSGTIASTVAGFTTGLSSGNTTGGLNVNFWFDNFGVWDSLSDTVLDTSVLELAPGTIPTIPEPSTASTLLVTLTGVFVAWRKRSRSANTIEKPRVG